MYLSITNKMQRYKMVFITINALHVSGVSSAHHQGIQNIGYFVELFLLLTAYSEFQLTHDSGKEPPETCTALIVTNVIVLRCVLLVLLQCNKYMLTFLKACILEQN